MVLVIVQQMLRIGRLLGHMLFCAGLLLSQTPDESPQVIRTGVSEVVLDVTVRDKNLSLNKKLRASDFTVQEDGRPQVIRGFRLVTGPETMGAARVTDGAAGPAKSLQELSFVSVVFGQMAPLSRLNAVEAATAFLELAVRGDTYGAVLGLNASVTRSDFTTDRARLVMAARRAGSSTRPSSAAASGAVTGQTAYSVTRGAGGVSITDAGNVAQSPDLATSGAAEAPFSEGQKAAAAAGDAQRSMISDIAGTAVLDALMRLIESESKLPGRKIVVYMYDGLVLPANRPEMMRRVIHAATQGRISFYCVDVRGLTNGTGLRITSNARQSTPSGASILGSDQMSAFELMEDGVVANMKLKMIELAESTGGLAIFSTNEFQKNMAMVVEDVKAHYEITYVPDSSVYDGRFRKVEVAVRRPELTVLSRDGYFALPHGAGTAAFETDGLHALEASRNDFPFRAAAMRFRPIGAGFGFQLVVDVDTAHFATAMDEDSHTARVHGTFVALVKNGSGEVVTKVSQEVDRAVPADKLAQFQRGKILLTLPFELAEGRYTVEAAVTDPAGNRASTKRISLIVPKPEGLSLSDVVLARSIQAISGERDRNDPLQFTGGKVSPSLSEIPEEAACVLFFVVYPDPGPGKPRVTVSFRKDGVEVSKVQPETGVPDDVNSIPMLVSVKLPAGDYVANVAVEQSSRVVRQSRLVSIAAK